MYSVYRVSDGEIVELRDGSINVTLESGFAAIAGTANPLTQKVVNGQLVNKTQAEIDASRPTPPDEKTATWDAIKSCRDMFEQYPLTISYGEFDADEKSLKRMELALEAFDSLPTLQSGQLTWKLADNSLLPLTKMQLEDVYDQIKTGIATRAATLHVQAEVFAANPPTVGHIKDPANWGM